MNKKKKELILRRAIEIAVAKASGCALSRHIKDCLAIFDKNNPSPVERGQAMIVRIKAMLRYNQATGFVTWRIDRRGRAKKGDRAGSRKKHDGYRHITILGRGFPEHHVAWVLVHGRFPKKYIDHKNGIRDDNRLVNLREATAFQNQGNRKLPIRNTTGFKGVYLRKGRTLWTATCCRKHIGNYATPEMAHAAYVKAAKASFGEFSRAA